MGPVTSKKGSYNSYKYGEITPVTHLFSAISGVLFTSFNTPFHTLLQSGILSVE